jgi:penicillin amidase
MRQLAAATALGLGLLLAGSAALANPASAVQESRTAPGLEASGQIIIDHWGIPHIYAASAHDAFFLQGYNAASSRLWQIDLWRKRGLGRLSASFGPDFVEQDRAARLFLYRGDMNAEWAAYPADAKGWTEAFAAGINAYVAEVKAGRRPLPPEFALTRSSPETWAAEDVVRIRSHALVSNLLGEVQRARSLCLGGLDLEPLRRLTEPKAHKLSIPKGFNPCDVTPDVLKDYLAATASVSFDGKSVSAEKPDLKRVAQIASEQSFEGSNNWVVAPSRTATGRPLLANDPHREHAVPSLRAVVHMDAPDLHIIGAGEPAIPGVSFGHNDQAAWGLTIFYTDQQDLYVYDTAADHPDAYRYKGGWEPLTVIKEAIPVKGEADRQVELAFTRHGPVISSRPGHLFAVRSVWSEPGAAGYFNASWMFKAKSWSDFEVAHNHWGAPPLNLVYADTTGDIGWMASSFTPIRPNWDGLTPVPGDGRYEWKGLLKGELMPQVRNPARGWIGTANEMNIPADYPNEVRKLGFEWADRSRIDRIEQVLASKPKFTVLDAMQLQTDTHSPLAARAASLVAGLTGDDADQSAAIALLKGWDGDERADSPQAALVEVWTAHHLRQDLIKAVVPATLQPAFVDSQLAAAVSFLEAGDKRLPPEAKAQLLKSSLGDAWRETAQKLGPDPTRWRWGALHRAVFTPSVGQLADPSLKAQMQVGPLQVGGSGSTPMATSYRNSDFNVISGASVRMVLDVGAWDNSMIINSPGQSGDPYSPHYRDLFPLWAAGAYAPLLYSKAAVTAQAERVITVSPGK